MKDFAINPHGNNFIRHRSGLRFTGSHLEYMAQKVRAAISLFSGEWYLNRHLGIPYIPDAMDKINHRALLETSLQVTISGVRGIKRLLSFTPSCDNARRLFKLHFVAQCDNGETLEMDEAVIINKGAL